MWKTKEIRDYIKPLIMNSGDNNSSSEISADSDHGKNEDHDQYKEDIER
jgi:hypothetical protein